MKLEVNISKRYFLTIVGIVLLLGAVGIGVAYGSDPADPAVFGHSADEIEGLDSLGGGGVPLGTIALFDDVCPSGWTHFDKLDDRFPLGSDTAGEQSAWVSSTGKTSVAGNTLGVDNADTARSPSVHSHQVPYRKVVYCEKTNGNPDLGTGTPSLTRIFCTAGAGDISLSGYTDGRTDTASCPAGYQLVFHSIDHAFGHLTDWNDHQDKEWGVQGDYTTNTITCQQAFLGGQARVGGIGLCAKV
jgi:hypothetical protein